jgi:hypothetical protein
MQEHNILVSLLKFYIKYNTVIQAPDKIIMVMCVKPFHQFKNLLVWVHRKPLLSY